MNSVTLTEVISSVCELLNWEDQALMMAGFVKQQIYKSVSQGVFESMLTGDHSIYWEYE